MEKTTRRSNRLGKGLGALIPTIKEDIDPKDIVSIQIRQIYANPDQPRWAGAAWLSIFHHPDPVP